MRSLYRLGMCILGIMEFWGSKLKLVLNPILGKRESKNMQLTGNGRKFDGITFVQVIFSSGRVEYISLREYKEIRERRDKLSSFFSSKKGEEK